MAKKQRVPGVLWWVYRNRAKTLLDTIISILPPPPSSPAGCRCKGLGCLGCSGSESLTYLLRPDDTSEYKNLLQKCFVVVSDDAPKLTVFYPDLRWTQREIVRKTIELIMCQTGNPTNSLCYGYNKFTQSSSVLDLLTTSAWSLLLKRIGDDIMVHLLKFASIFLPLPRENHHQVAGVPISHICPRFSRCTSETADVQPLCFESGPSRKRKRTTIADKSESNTCAQGSSSSLDSFTPGGSDLWHVQKKSEMSSSEMNQLKTCTKIDAFIEKSSEVLKQSSSKGRTTSRKRSKPLRWQRCRKRRLVSGAEDNALSSCVSSLKCKENFTEKLQEDSSTSLTYHHEKELSFLGCFKTCTKIDTLKEKSNGVRQQSSTKGRTKSKRSRPLSWQRCRKHRLVSCAEDNTLSSCISSIKCKENFTDKLQGDSSTSLPYHHGKELSCLESERQHTFSSHSRTCFCSSMLQAQQIIGEETQIIRKSMFRDSSCFSSLFPRDHLLTTLKPNDAGAVCLMKDIFSLSDEDLITKATPCLHNSSSCVLGCTFLYQSLRQLLKRLIRKAQGCQYLKLLSKHCAVPAISPSSKGESVSVLEGDDSHMKLLEERHDAREQESNLPLENFDGPVNKFRRKQQNRTPRSCDHQLDLSGSYCRKSQVVSLVWAVCRSIVPRDLLGAPSDWKALRKNISKFIRLRRFEKFSLRQCVHGLKTSTFPLLSNKHSSCYLNCCVPEAIMGSANMLIGCKKISNLKSILKKKLFLCWIHWFFQCLVVPILQASFYITETQCGKLDFFYYSKPIWKNLTGTAVKTLREKNYRLLDDEVLRTILSNRSFGFSKVRLLPKEKGVRALANLKALSRLSVVKKTPLRPTSFQDYVTRSTEQVKKFKYFKPVNSALRDLSTVLKGIKMNHPEKLGSSVFDYNDVYKKLSQFLIRLKDRFKSMPSVFLVVCDVSKAFDSIDQDKLLTVMKDVMLKDEYLIKESYQVVCTKNCMWVHSDPTLSDQNMKTCTTKSTASRPFHSLHSVLMNQETSRKIRKQELARDLYEHVKCNVLQLGQDFYVQEVGISQGSVISTLLCSFYYAHMENNVIFPFLENVQEICYLEDTEGEVRERHTCQDDDSVENGLKDDISASPIQMLLRFTDDFLFISTSKKHAENFFSRLSRGVRDYNCSINEAKSCMSFDMVDSISGLIIPKRMYTGEDGISFIPWCGLLLNCCTLEIQADYTRYLGFHLSSTLSVRWQRKPGCHLKEKLRQYMLPKCHPIFYDSNINSASIVRLNIYQAFLLSAMKFHSYVSNLSSACSLPADYNYEIVKSCLRSMYQLIVKSMRPEKLGPGVRPILRLRKEEVEWLGLNAYIRVLKKKQTRHAELLSMLRSELLTHKRVPSASLNYAVEDSHSSVFWQIKY